VLSVVGQTAAIGTYFWGKRRANRPRPQEEWLPLVVDPIVDREVFDVVQRLRQSRDPATSPGRSVAKPHLLTGLLRCAKCGASYQLETSGKKVEGGVYRYCYYNCRNALRAGVEVCSGFRIPTEALADSTCSAERARQLGNRRKWMARPEEITRTWRQLVTSHPTVSRSYLMHLVERIEVDGTQITITPRRVS
jgi:hypothetical protein